MIIGRVGRIVFIWHFLGPNRCLSFLAFLRPVVWRRVFTRGRCCASLTIPLGSTSAWSFALLSLSFLLLSVYLLPTPLITLSVGIAWSALTRSLVHRMHNTALQPTGLSLAPEAFCMCRRCRCKPANLYRGNGDEKRESRRTRHLRNGEAFSSSSI